MFVTTYGSWEGACLVLQVTLAFIFRLLHVILLYAPVLFEAGVLGRFVGSFDGDHGSETADKSTESTRIQPLPYSRLNVNISL